MPGSKKQEPRKSQDTTETPPPITSFEPNPAAVEPMQTAMKEAFTPPQPDPDAPKVPNPDVKEHDPQQGKHWHSGSLPEQFNLMRDEAREVALQVANDAVAAGKTEENAIVDGVIAAKNWAKMHNVSVRKS